MMAEIKNAQLEIRPERMTETALVRVSCMVRFGNDEVAKMSTSPGRMYFSLYCRLYGEDTDYPALNRLHDEVYVFPSRILPQREPAAMEKVTFEVTLSQRILDEDLLGADEIFARLELRGWIGFKGLLVEAQTNVISYAFA